MSTHNTTRLIATLALATTVTTARALDIHVPADHVLIELAIANAADGDVVIVAPGTYFEHDLDLGGKAITVTSSGGPATTTIDALGLGHIFIATGGEGADTVIEGFTLTGGDATGGPNSGDDRGGGIWIENSSPTVRNCTFRMNDAVFGGAMWINGGAPSIEDCVFDDNFSTLRGGAVYLNNADGTQITGCLFTLNEAGTSGAGISSYESTATVRRSEFRNNDAAFDGDGIYNVAFSTMLVVNSVFHGDDDAFYNGANTTMNVVNCTSTDSFRNSGFGTLNVTNCVVWDATIGTAGTVSVSYSMVQGGYPGTNNLEPAEGPLFVDAAGGDLRLQEMSAAVDAGNSAAVTGVFPEYAVDFDGNTRVVDAPKDDTGLAVFSLTIDMGAYEVQSGPLVTCPADVNGDNEVGIEDFLALLGAWGPCP